MSAVNCENHRDRTFAWRAQWASCVFTYTVRVCSHWYKCLCELVHVHAFLGGNRTVKCQKKSIRSTSLVISGIYHCGNQHQRKCQGRLVTLVRGVRNQATLGDDGKPYWFFTEGESRKFIIPSLHALYAHPSSPARSYNENIAFPNTITSPLRGNWSIVWLCMIK